VRQYKHFVKQVAVSGPGRNTAQPAGFPCSSHGQRPEKPADRGIQPFYFAFQAGIFSTACVRKTATPYRIGGNHNSPYVNETD